MNKQDETEFDSILDIDKTRLDEECEKQPHLVWQYGALAAKAGKILDDAIASIKIVEAEVDGCVRECPADYGLEKTTDAAIKNAVLRSREYKDVINKVNTARRDLNMLNAANQALDHRRTSLSMLDGQQARGYFSKPHQEIRTDTGKSPVRKPLTQRKKE